MRSEIYKLKQIFHQCIFHPESRIQRAEIFMLDYAYNITYNFAFVK